MADDRQKDRYNRPVSAAGITRFPSADLWEDPWEPNLDLFALRRKKERLNQAYRLATDLRPDLEIPMPEASKLEMLVASLGLGQERGMQLADDIAILAKWFFLPKVGKQIAIGRESMLDQLQQAGQYADTLYMLIGGIAPQVEELAGDFDLALPLGSGGQSLMRFADDVGRLGLVAREILRVMRPRARPRESRRNNAIVLASQAVEGASGVRIETSRDTSSRSGQHFTNAQGQFVAEVMKMLTRSSESVVAGRFSEMRKAPASTNP